MNHQTSLRFNAPETESERWKFIILFHDFDSFVRGMDSVLISEAYRNNVLNEERITVLVHSYIEEFRKECDEYLLGQLMALNIIYYDNHSETLSESSERFIK
jgi:hypothetical protein